MAFERYKYDEQSRELVIRVVEQARENGIKFKEGALERILKLVYHNPTPKKEIFIEYLNGLIEAEKAELPSSPGTGNLDVIEDK